jgi:hypothetical protein
VVCAICLAAVAGSGHAQLHSKRAGACTPRHTTVRGHPAVVECGPATATVRYAGKTFTFSGGTCSKVGFWNVYIGTRVTGGASKNLFFAFGSVKKDGTYTQHDFEVGFQNDYAVFDLGKGTTTLSRNLRHGTFSGTVLTGPNLRPNGKRMSGSFSC